MPSCWSKARPHRENQGEHEACWAPALPEAAELGPIRGRARLTDMPLVGTDGCFLMWTGSTTDPRGDGGAKEVGGGGEGAALSLSAATRPERGRSPIVRLAVALLDVGREGQKKKKRRETGSPQNVIVRSAHAYPGAASVRAPAPGCRFCAPRTKTLARKLAASSTNRGAGGGRHSHSRDHKKLSEEKKQNRERDF